MEICPRLRACSSEVFVEREEVDVLFVLFFHDVKLVV